MSAFIEKAWEASPYFLRESSPVFSLCALQHLTWMIAQAQFSHHGSFAYLFPFPDCELREGRMSLGQLGAWSMVDAQ